jgi:hypothetical protein
MVIFYNRDGKRYGFLHVYKYVVQIQAAHIESKFDPQCFEKAVNMSG